MVLEETRQIGQHQLQALLIECLLNKTEVTKAIYTNRLNCV